MKVYRIAVGINSKFAHIHAQIGQDFSKEIKVMWDDCLAKGNIVPDFIYSAYIICKKEIAKNLKDNFNGLSVTSLNWEKNPKELCAKNTNRLKWLPKCKTEMACIFTTVDVPILPQSTVKYGISGLTGKDCIKEIIGSAKVHGDNIIPREKGKGLFFNQKDIGDYAFFKPMSTFFLLCTEAVKEYVENKQYSNILFLEVGEIID
jgi:hypothetical protein